jgi:hypothetical protein
MTTTYFTLQNKGENTVANLSLFNPITATSTIPAVIDIALEKPIPPKASDYKKTIVRFNAPLNSISPNYLMSGRTFTILFIRGSNIQTGSVSGSNILGFSIANFIEVINTLMQNLASALESSSGTPYFIFDENTGKFYLIVSHTFANNTSIEINKDLHFFMSGLPTTLLSNGFDDISLKSPLNDNYYYYFSPVYNNQPPQIPLVGNLPTQYNAIKLASEYNTDYRFNLLQFLMILSNISVRQETLPLATQNAVANQNNPLSYIASRPILNGFRGLIERYGEQNSNLLFTNQRYFRWIDLLSDKPLDRLSFDFRWQKTDQSLEQLKLEPGESISIKLYFKIVEINFI